VAKPAVRIGIDVDRETWNTLLKVEKFDGVRTYEFLIDTSQPTVWLYLIGESQEVLGRLHDITTKDGGLPTKSAGNWRDSAELFGLYFQAALTAARLGVRLKEATGGPAPDYRTAEEDFAAAVRVRDLAKASLESAITRDTQDLAELKEAFDNDDIDYEHLGPTN
jgi:hypothetical protein